MAVPRRPPARLVLGGTSQQAGPRGDRRHAAEDRAAEDSGVRGYVEHTVGDRIMRKDESVLAIQKAELYRGEEGRDEIFVQATVRGGHEGYRDCFLMEERAWRDLKRSFESGNTPDPRVQLESSWSLPLQREEFSGDETFAVVFQEDPDAETPDPRETPFFALCFRGSEGRNERLLFLAWYDVAHVEGTPEAT